MTQFYRPNKAGMLAALLAAALPLSASASEDFAGVWGIFSATDAFETPDGKSRWRYWFDGQARYFDLGSGINTYVLRPGIGYDVSDNMSVWAGYGYFHGRTRTGDHVYENRFWQQLSWGVPSWELGTLSMRARLEQRSISRGDDLGWVLRYQAKLAIPVADSPDLEFIVAIEPFFKLNDTDWGGESGLGQNRTAIALGWKLSPKVAIETGYVHQYIWVDNADNVVNHLGVVNLKMKF